MRFLFTVKILSLTIYEIGFPFSGEKIRDTRQCGFTLLISMSAKLWI